MSVVTEIYRALQEQDVARLRRLLHPDFEGHIAPGMPYGVGGIHGGAQAMISEVWGVLARWYDTAPYPDSIIETTEGLTIATGKYRGVARSTGRAYEAEFAHLWRVEGERASSLHQYTDTASWLQALTQPGDLEDHDDSKVFHQVSVGVLIRGDRVLLCHRRPDNRWYPDVWDFFGGHIEADETPAAAVRREGREELGIEIELPLAALDRWIADDEDITFFRVDHWTGEPRNLAPEEHDDIQWFTLAEALDRKLPDVRYTGLLRDLLTPG